MELLTAIINYLVGMPPPYNARYDLNADGFITIADFLAALALL